MDGGEQAVDDGDGEGSGRAESYYYTAELHAAVSRSCACIGSPCLRRCVHGAPIGGGGGEAAAPDLWAAADYRSSS
jgi:hypothetical protein